MKQLVSENGFRPIMLEDEVINFRGDKGILKAVEPPKDLNNSQGYVHVLMSGRTDLNRWYPGVIRARFIEVNGITKLSCGHTVIVDLDGRENVCDCIKT